MLHLNSNKIINIITLTIILLLFFFFSDYRQYSFASDITEKKPFTTKNFSIYIDPKEWQLVKQKKESPADDPTYIKIDIGNALSDPIIGKGSERVLIVLEDGLEFKNNQKQIYFFCYFSPIPLWQMEDKTIEQFATAFRDTYLLNSNNDFVNIKNCDIKYFTKEINGSPFFYVSYAYDGITSFGYKSYSTSAVYTYISRNLRKRYSLNVYYYDSQKSLEESKLRNILESLITGFEPIDIDANSEYLDYVIDSANSLYIALRRQAFFNEEDKQPMSIYKTPIRIEENDSLKRRILITNLIDIRQHSIQKEIESTIELLNEASQKYINEPKIYYGLGLLHEFNSFGERYGNGFHEDLVIEAYQEALRINPNFVPARYNLAILYLRNGDLERGIKELNKLIAKNEKAETEVYCALAYGYEKKNDFASAINYYKLALNNFTGKDKQVASDLFKDIKEKIKHLSR